MEIIIFRSIRRKDLSLHFVLVLIGKGCPFVRTCNIFFRRTKFQAFNESCVERVSHNKYYCSKNTYIKMQLTKNLNEF